MRGAGWVEWGSARGRLHGGGAQDAAGNLVLRLRMDSDRSRGGSEILKNPQEEGDPGYQKGAEKGPTEEAADGAEWGGRPAMEWRPCVSRLPGAGDSECSNWIWI